MFRYLLKRSVTSSALRGVTTLRHCSNVVLGNPERGQMSSVHVSWTDLVGDESAAPATRLAAGRILSLMDLCAARTADSVVSHANLSEKILTCTVGVTNTTFACPILHGDAVRLDGRVVHLGASSMGVYIRFFRQSQSGHLETLAGESFFTMVAIRPDLTAAKIVPSMTLTDPLDIVMSRRYDRIRQVQKENNSDMRNLRRQELAWRDVTCAINEMKSSKVSIESTTCCANRGFFSSYLNNNNTVFGGELMAWMERHATRCGRVLTGNRHVYTLGMHSVSFNEPVFASDWLTLQASVVYIRNTTMEVDVTLRAERRGTGAVVTNRAAFVLISNNDVAQKEPIHVGLDLENASQDDLHRYLEAKIRYHRSVDRRIQYKDEGVHP